MYNDNERNHDYRRKKKRKIESTGVPAEANKAIVVPGSAPRFSGDLRITVRSWE